MKKNRHNKNRPKNRASKNKPINDDFKSAKRWNHKLKGETVEEMLPEVFEKTFEVLKAQFDKMKADQDFKSCKAFGHLNSGFNLFKLDIFGGALPDNSILQQNPDAPPQDTEHFEQNMREMNASLLKVVFEEMQKQNITGAGSPIMAHSTIGILDEFYVFTMVWECFPQDYHEINPIAANAMNN